MGEHDQMQNYERMIKKYQLLKSDNLKRAQEHPEDGENVARANARIDEEIASIQRVMENIKQRQLREAKFRPVQRAVPQTYTPNLEEKPPQEKKLREISHDDFSKLEPPAKNEFLKAVQAIKKETIEGALRPQKDISDARSETSQSPSAAKAPKDISGSHQKQDRHSQEKKGERTVSIFDEEEA